MAPIPDGYTLVVPRTKAVDYLLSLEHRDGGSKARFFLAAGFRREAWEVFAAALRRHFADSPFCRHESRPHGESWVVEGPLALPTSGFRLIRVVWAIDHERQELRMTTAYPIEAIRP